MDGEKFESVPAQALPGATIPLDSNGAHSGDSEVKNEREATALKMKLEKLLQAYLIHRTDAKVQTKDAVVDDDAAEAADDRYHKRDARDGGGKGKKDKNNNKKQKGVPKDGRREDLTTFDGKCPIHQVKGYCHLGWKCRFVGSHSKERDTEDGRKELVLIEDSERTSTMVNLEDEVDVANVVSKDVKIGLAKRKINTPRSDQYMKWIDSNKDTERAMFDSAAGDNEALKDEKEARRAEFVEAPFRPSEKRRLYYGPETPSLAPLTTQGNMPYRRLCVDLGCQITWSEMAMGMPLIQGERGEWALMKAHESEISPPKFLQKNTVVQGYDNASDMKFGAQIAANKPWLAAKTLRAIDLNCGCPINLVCEKGAGSALLDQDSKLESILRGMSYVSKETPITVKIRMGTKDNNPTATKLIRRLVLAATRLFNPAKAHRALQRLPSMVGVSSNATPESEKDARTDTIAEADPRDLANGGHVYFVGNGDCYSHEDYYNNINNSGVDSVLIGRGALIKPWIFEEIEKGQYLDKSATERLTYIEKFANFAHRYVPVGLLEHLPPNIQDRPPRFKGRDDLETLMASENYKDWIKLSEMFLGPAHPNFKFEPKHKSNAYEIEAEG
ncbi:FMN-linked oxidoreductase [Lizonia empirigonia]|nr:FMN-linked oxidoreductase [Lizonia empirigonia]